MPSHTDMLTPAIPENDAQRVQTLRQLGVLDTPPEERFDRLTRMARRWFGIPIALVSLVDENRQWFKSRAGLDIPETPRDVSFCGHALLGDQIFMVPDALADPRFSDNPLVTGHPYIRFYAGVPLRIEDGTKLGTFCIMGSEPRVLDIDECEMLLDLASMAEQELAAERLASVDELTRIANRRGFNAMAPHLLHLCRRDDRGATLFFFDLDWFKQINDTLGHAEGDRVLRKFASLLQDAFRESDLIGRLGGDEFVALATHDGTGVRDEIVQRLAQSVAAYNASTSHAYPLRYSVGMVGFDPQRHPSVEAMIAEADALMYANKQARRGLGGEAG